MMKNSNAKTSLARQSKTIIGALMTLTTAAVVAMAPTSQAFAYQRITDTQNVAPNRVAIFFLGHGRTLARAKADANNGASCAKAPFSRSRQIVKQDYSWWNMYNGTWWNATVVVHCEKI